MLAFIRQEPTIEVAFDLAQRFGSIVKNRQQDQLDPWLEAALGSGIPDLPTFAGRLMAAHKLRQIHQIGGRSAPVFLARGRLPLWSSERNTLSLSLNQVPSQEKIVIGEVSSVILRTDVPSSQYSW